MSDDREEGKKHTKKRRLKRAIVGVAPQIAHALGGPLAGAAVRKLSNVLFGSEDATEEEIENAIATASPEQWIALQRADHEFKIALRQAAVEEERVHAGDRDSARRRQQQMHDWTPSVLGTFVIIGFFVVLGAMLSRSIPVGAETEFSIMLGALATMTAAVVNYFFGSSAGSKEKTRILHPLVEKRDAGEL